MFWICIIFAGYLAGKLCVYEINTFISDHIIIYLIFSYIDLGSYDVYHFSKTEPTTGNNIPATFDQHQATGLVQNTFILLVKVIPLFL